MKARLFVFFDRSFLRDTAAVEHTSRQVNSVSLTQLSNADKMIIQFAEAIE